MNTDIRLAFAHPSERSEATARRPVLDRISVRDHIVEADIGAFQAERGVPQRIAFNVVVEVQPIDEPIDDDVDRILSYDKVTEAIALELADERINLLETLAEGIAARILCEPQAVRAFVRIEKLDRGPGALGVEIVRNRGDSAAPQGDATPAPHPSLVYLSTAAIASPHLSKWIDGFEGQNRPLIFCVGAPEAPAPQCGHNMAQRRIDLLAIEQNAWMLAARDDRCVVVSTRTELDWAMKNGQTCVWAPSKIVLDAVDGPSAHPRDAVALAAWFAAMVEAEALTVVGAPLPEEAAVLLRQRDADVETL